MIDVGIILSKDQDDASFSLEIGVWNIFFIGVGLEVNLQYF